MTRDVFEHCAHEAYDDLLSALRALAPLVARGETAAIAPRFIEVAREAHARASLPHVVAPDEQARTRARLAEIGLGDVVVPEVVADARWRSLQRSLARVDRIRALGGMVELILDSVEHLARTLDATPFVAPRELRWSHPRDFVRDAIALAMTTGDDVGIGDAINDTPEAAAFFARYPDAYSYWDLHGAPDPDEDPDLPDPLRYPAAIWIAPAITLHEPFADAPCGHAGPATMQPPTTAPASRLHPALIAACERAAHNGHALVGYVTVSP